MLASHCASFTVFNRVTVSFGQFNYLHFKIQIWEFSSETTLEIWEDWLFIIKWFLLTYLNNNLIRTFFNFRVSNSHLKSSHAYHACLIKILEIKWKYQELEHWIKNLTTGTLNLQKRYVLLIILILFAYFIDKMIGSWFIIRIFILKNFLIWVWRCVKDHMTMIK